MAIDDQVDRCWRRAELEEYASGKLEQRQATLCEKHLAVCSACQQVLAEIFDSGASPEWLELRDAGRPSAGNTPSPVAHQLWLDQQGIKSKIESLPAQVGRYRLVDVLGEGGFGKVYLAYDEKLKRNVAVKIPHARVIKSASQLDLLLTEAQTVAALDHPSITPIYDVGSTEDQPLFLVSKLIEGCTLAEHSQKRRRDTNVIVRQMIDVAEALHYAHQRGVIHRDLKPQNILIDISGHVFLTDFGLAWRDVDDSRQFPRAGTPAYMSPEQRADQFQLIDHRSDIYSLGKVLWEILSGHNTMLYDSTSMLTTSDASVADASLDTHVGQETHPEDIASAITVHDGAIESTESVPAELGEVCRKATQIDIAQRYDSAAQMAADLRAYLQLNDEADKPAAQIQASPESVTQALAKPRLTRTQRVTLVSCLAIFVAVVGLWGYRANWQRQKQNALDRYFASAPADLQKSLAQLQPYFDSARADLERELSSTSSDRQLRAQIALMGSMPELLPQLTDAMLEASAGSVEIYIQALKPYAAELSKRLWDIATIQPSRRTGRALNALTFLAQTEPTSPRWSESQVQLHLSTSFSSEDMKSVASRLNLFMPIRDHLIVAIRVGLRDPTPIFSGDQRSKIYQIWEALVKDDVERSIDLMLEGPPWIYASVLGRLKDDAQTIAYLRARMQLPDPQQTTHWPRALQDRHLAGIGLLMLGHEDEYWNLWNYSEDPTHLNVQMSILGFGPLTRSVLLAHMRDTGLLKPTTHKPTGFHERLYTPTLVQLRWLMMGLAKRNEDILSSQELAELSEAARQIAVHDADSGNRAVAEYYLKTVEAEVPGREPRDAAQASDRNWSVNSLREVMVHIEQADQQSQAFAIASCELQRKHFEQFLTASGYAWSGSRVNQQLGNAKELLSCAQVELSWYDCAAFCNWLSRQEGLDEVYVPNSQGQFADGMQIKPNYQELNGYRLPTGKEWLIACRAGTTTRYYYGDRDLMNFKYSWHLPHSEGRSRAVGTTYPNALGLFDTLGNAAEWTMEVAENLDVDLKLDDRIPRIYRGGSFDCNSADVRADAFKSVLPGERLPMTGMRLTRSLKTTMSK